MSEIEGNLIVDDDKLNSSQAVANDSTKAKEVTEYQPSWDEIGTPETDQSQPEIVSFPQFKRRRIHRYAPREWKTMCDQWEDIANCSHMIAIMLQDFDRQRPILPDEDLRTYVDIIVPKLTDIGEQIEDLVTHSRDILRSAQKDIEDIIRLQRH